MQPTWRSALVTGASSGIGEAFARELTSAGCAVTLVARRAERLEALAAELAAVGGRADVVVADLAEPSGREAVASRLRHRPVDVLVNNAGLGLGASFVDGSPETYRQMIEVNVAAVVELSQAALGPMLDSGRGWILNVSSLGGHAPGPGFAVYSATKAFVTSFSEALHEEYRRSGVVITAVCPGATRTEFGDLAGAGNDDLPAVLVQDATAVAREGLAALAAGRAVRVTGWPNRLTAGVTAAMPRVARRWAAGRVADRL